MNTSTSKTVIRLGNETKLLAHLLFNAEITKLEATIKLGDPQVNSTVSRINNRLTNGHRWVMNRMAPETRRDGTQSSPVAHYWINPQYRLQVLDYVNHQRQGQQLPPLELPPLPAYPEGHPAWQLVKKGGAGHVA